MDLEKNLNKLSVNFVEKPRVFADLPPEKAIGTYFTSLQTKYLTYPPQYRNEYSGTSKFMTTQSLRLERERNEWLQFAKEKMIQRRRTLDAKWKMLSQEEKMFKRCMIKYNDFVKGNHEKRLRSVQKLKELEEIDSVRLEKTKQLSKRYDRALKIRDLMEETINKYIFYEQYLISVVHIAQNEFKNPHDIVARYEALMDAKALIMKQEEKLFSTLQDAIASFLKMNKDNELKLVGLMNKVNELYTRYESAKSNVNKWEGQVGMIYDYAIEINRKLLDVKQSCTSLYENCCKRNKGSLFDKDMDIKGQLAVIKRVLTDFKHINESFNLYLGTDSKLLL